MAEAVQNAEYQFKVLIVDDDLTILSLLKELVSMVPGCEVITASQPDEAMKTIIGENVDIVFTDVHMPGVTGIEMIKDILSLEQCPEVIVMTAYPSGDIAMNAMELGASSLISKPFEDISIVELELDKAIKKILRQRSAAQEVEQKKKELSAKSSGEVDQDEPMKVELPSIADETVSEDTAESPKAPEAKIYPQSILEPLFEIEVQRCKRSKKNFTLGYVDIPDNLQLKTKEDKEKFRQSQIDRLRSCFRNSDVIIDAGKDGFIVLGFECNKPGSHVLEFKLNQAGFQNFGFGVYPVDGEDFKSLSESARSSLVDKRKHRIVLLEQDEFFGRIVQNMLVDPKYHVTWAKSIDEAKKHIQQHSEQIKIFIISLTKDPKQWEMLATMKKEGLTQWPILLFTDVALDEKIKKQLHKLGVKALIRKGASQEEILYVVQSFIMLPSVSVIRKNPRALVTLPVVYRHGDREVSSNTFTLSRDGVFIREMNPVPTGEELEIEVLIPGRKGPIKTQGEVIYAVPYFVGVSRIHVAGMAIRFKGLPDAERKELDEFISNAMTGYLIDPN